MQTITVARINRRKIDADEFVRGVKTIKVRRVLKAGDNRLEELDFPVAEQLNTQTSRLRSIATAIIRRKRPATIVSTSLVKGYLQRTETEEEVEDFTRLWIGHRNYVLFIFMAGFPGGTYPSHRLIVAKSLTKDKLEEDQQLVIPIRYDLPCVREKFGTNIWDQNFQRMDPIQRGRIRGSHMKDDPLYPEFQEIETYIGVEVPITGSQEMIKVFFDGRVQFMGLQPTLIEEPSTRDNSLETIIQVLDKLSSCEI
jgi:hypothetical protein